MPIVIAENNNSGLITTSRREVKYRVDSVKFDSLQKAVLKPMSSDRLKEDATSFRISIYLDTADRRFSRAELGNAEPSIKYRVRDYYSLKEEKPVFNGDYFFEMKRRLGQMVQKGRLSIPRKSSSDILSNITVLSDMAPCSYNCEPFNTPGYHEPLLALFAVHYRRCTLEDSAVGYRITFDDMVTYHDVSDGALDTSLFRLPALPSPMLTDPSRVIEVKSIHSLPAWVNDIFAGEQPSSQSKFGIGVRELKRREMLFPKSAEDQ